MNSQTRKEFNTAKAKAEKVLQEPEKVDKLLVQAEEKAHSKRSILGLIWEKFMSLLRMVRAWRNGSYSRIPWKSLVLSIASLIYFLNPFDLIFDYIPIIGFIDDATVIAFVLGAIRKDIEIFEEWERRNNVFEVNRA